MLFVFIVVHCLVKRDQCTTLTTPWNSPCRVCHQLLTMPCDILLFFVADVCNLLCLSSELIFNLTFGNDCTSLCCDDA